MRFFHFDYLLVKKNEWLQSAYVGIDSFGKIAYLSFEAPKESSAVEYVKGIALPGFQNAHSHAFQYAMAGRAETHARGASDDFWSWREAMYACALSMNPDEMQAVARMLYAELLRKGYTHVAEFHYLHHDKDGRPFANLSEMGTRLLEAAKDAGIRITLIPVFYQKGGFGMEPTPRQRRFISKTVDDYFNLLDDSADAVKHYEHANLGFSVHSLRAVDYNDILTTFTNGPSAIPFHLHVSEQLKEVDDCVAHLKERPVEWVLNHLPVDSRFHLVHCTHMNDDEVRRLAESGANAVLCPGTEGNLGDGIFRLTDFARHGGSWSIGTDSHISINPMEDLRWLDYAQRFTTHKRNTFDDGASVLTDTTWRAGKRAMGESKEKYFEIGNAFDAVVYRSSSPVVAHRKTDHLLSSILYNADSGDVVGTIVNGKWIVKEQHHPKERLFREEYSKVIKAIQF